MYECMYVCMYVCVCIYVCMYVCMYILYMYVCMHACMYVYMYVYIMNVCMYVYICIYVCIMYIYIMYVCIYVCIYYVCVYVCMYVCTWSDKKVRELIAVKVLHTSLLKTTVVAFKVLPLRSYAQMPAPSPPCKTILELVLWNGLQSCCCITPDVINVIKMPSVQYLFYLRELKKVTGG